MNGLSIDNIDLLKTAVLLMIPLIYEFIMYKINNKFNKENSRKGIFILSGIINYTLLMVFIVNSYKITNEYVIYNKVSEIANMSYNLYIIFMVIYAIMSISGYYGTNIKNKIKTPILHTAIMLMAFTLFIFIHNVKIGREIDLRTFNNKRYNTELSTLNLMPYNIEDKTEEKDENNIEYIKYKFLDTSGNIIEKLLNFDGSISIIEEGINSIPRIDIIKNYKSLNSKYSNLYSEYYTYKIYVPSIEGWLSIIEKENTVEQVN